MLATFVPAALVVACGLLAALFAVRAISRGRRRRPASAVFNALVAAVLLLLAGGAALAGVDLQSYMRLTAETPAAEMRFRQTSQQRFAAEVIYPDGRRESFALAGDEWQLDARVLKWHGPATLLGLDTAFRLDRIGGRYRDIELERTAPRTVHELGRPPGIDVWRVVRRFQRWLPWLDAACGSATYLPMSDDAHYAVSVSSTGLLARPLNRAAREAVSTWH